MNALRQKVLDYINAHGSTKQWFAKQLGISHTHFSLWLKEERELSEEKEKRLKEILDK